MLPQCGGNYSTSGMPSKGIPITHTFHPLPDHWELSSAIAVSVEQYHPVKGNFTSYPADHSSTMRQCMYAKLVVVFVIHSGFTTKPDLMCGRNLSELQDPLPHYYCLMLVNSHKTHRGLSKDIIIHQINLHVNNFLEHRVRIELTNISFADCYLTIQSPVHLVGCLWVEHSTNGLWVHCSNQHELTARNWCGMQESNPHSRCRRPLHYPLY